MDEQIIAKQFTRVPRRPQSVAKDGFQEQVLKTIGGQHFAKTLDISPVSIEYGTVTLKMPVQPKIFQQLGYVHGGAITSLLDTATGMCSVT
ncbi:MAG: PaaI family thioesterase, partial [Alphaproteobacteria bacterium]